MLREWMTPVMTVLLLLAPSLSAEGGAGERRSPALIEPDASPSPFLLTSTEARVVVTGLVAHVEVTQAWENPNSTPVDGLYIFPLPENAAVTDMSLRIANREIRGEMRRREEARQIYEQARREGRVAGLLDQERANVFVQQVANIVPGERIQVVIEFDHEIRCDEGRCEYVYPTVVGPRFIPARQADPGCIDPPVVAPGGLTRQRLSLSLELDTGVSVREIESPSHRILITGRGGEARRVTLADDGGEVLNRDFKLRWKLGSDDPEVGVLAWRDPGRGSEEGVFTLILQPPLDPGNEEAAPRELVFVLDCSGSMMGVPLEAAKNVVRKALGAVRPGDTFQIVRFSDHASGLGPAPLPATPDNVRRALAYLDSLQGEGGTEMIEGIRASLGFPADPRRLRIVAFLTDGYIGNESEILGEVRKRIGGARLFSFGIGSSVNRYLLEGLAEEGRGQAAFLGPRETPDQMVERFVRRISTPVLTDVRLTWRGLDATDLIPEQIPDLFAGQPLVIHGRYRQPGRGVIELEGWSQGRRRIFRDEVTLPARAEDHEALGRLWARARIHQLERKMHDGARAELVDRITALGIQHHLMTAYTSLVAVDSAISNWTGSSTSVPVPVEMPEDVSYLGNFGVADKSKVAFKQVAQNSVAAPPPPVTAPGLPGDSRSSAKESTVDSVLSRAGSIEESDRKEKAQGDPTGGIRKDRDRLPFTRLTLLENGGEITLEGDGRLWRTEGSRRVAIRSLSDPEMDEIRRLLTLAHADRWTGGGSGARIILEAQNIRRVAGLSPAETSVEALAEYLRALAR